MATTLSESIPEMEAFIKGEIEALGRRGAVVGVSGGIDSAVALALAARSLGPENVLAVAMPERENSEESLTLAQELSTQLNVRLIVDDLTAGLDALGCYRLRDQAIASIPGLGYEPNTDGVSVRLMQDLRHSRMPAAYVVDVVKPNGQVHTRRLSRTAYSDLFAASNQKQRLRALRLYHHAERLQYGVLGTSNYDETFLGFFVKLGDGSWDLCPIDHLLKTEVFELASLLEVPDRIVNRTTTTDTFPNGGQSQQDMFYGLPFDELDVILRAERGDIRPAAAASLLGWEPDEIDNALHNLTRRHRSTTWNRRTGISFKP